MTLAKIVTSVSIHLAITSVDVVMVFNLAKIATASSSLVGELYTSIPLLFCILRLTFLNFVQSHVRIPFHSTTRLILASP